MRSENIANHGDAVVALWLELSRTMSDVLSYREEAAWRYYSGKIAGLRMALPLVRGSECKTGIVRSRLVFLPVCSSEDLKGRAAALKRILHDDFEALNEGGKSGLKKEWLEGHIYAIGLSLALLQPHLG